jgi:hypothetical protein
MSSRRPSFRQTARAEEESSALGELANELERERDARKEERFLLVMIVAIIVDAYLFSHIENWSGPVVIGIIELVAIAVVARKWGIEEVAQFLAMFFQRVAEHSKPPAAINPPPPEPPSPAAPAPAPPLQPPSPPLET